VSAKQEEFIMPVKHTAYVALVLTDIAKTIEDAYPFEANSLVNLAKAIVSEETPCPCCGP
jgi:hypothetical protein